MSFDDDTLSTDESFKVKVEDEPVLVQQNNATAETEMEWRNFITKLKKKTYTKQ